MALRFREKNKVNFVSQFQRPDMEETLCIQCQCSVYIKRIGVKIIQAGWQRVPLWLRPQIEKTGNRRHILQL